MDALDAQAVEQAQEIVGAGTRLRSRRVDHSTAPTAPVKGDEAVAGRGECGNLIFPNQATTGGRVEEHHGCSATAGILVENPRSGEFRGSLTYGLGGKRGPWIGV